MTLGIFKPYVDPFVDQHDFMQACGDELPHIASLHGELTQQTKRYRNLIDEEVRELDEAIALPTNDLGQVIDKLAAIGDACTDIIYVTIGVMHSLGIPPAEFWNEVQRSNMQKVDPITGKIRRRITDGKILKPDGWRPPETHRLIAEALITPHKGGNA